MNSNSDAALVGDDIRYFSLARHALVEALRMLGMSEGQKVLVPAFICRDLLASVHAVKAVPLFYPVDQSLAPESLPEDVNIRAVLAVNYFGFPQNLSPFRAYCSAHGAALIEDNAHGFLSCDERGISLGRRGDFGIVSIRKTFALPDGDALMVNRKEWLDRIPAQLACRKDRLPPSYSVKNIFRQIQNSTGIRIRSSSEQAIRYLRRIRTGHSLPLSRPESEHELPGTPAIHCESLRMLSRIDASGEVLRRRALYERFQRELSSFGVEPVFGDLPKGVSPYGYPFRATDAGAAAAISLTRRSGFDCFSWPDLPSAVSQHAPEFYRNVWWVNFLC